MDSVYLKLPYPTLEELGGDEALNRLSSEAKEILAKAKQFLTAGANPTKSAQKTKKRKATA